MNLEIDKEVNIGIQKVVGHKGHLVKSLQNVLEKCLMDKNKLKLEIEEAFKKVDAAIQYFTGIEEIFLRQKNLFLQKLQADFDVIRKLIERKEMELRDKIE